MSTRDIAQEIKELYGCEISEELVSDIIDKIISEIEEWKTRALDEVYAVVYIDAFEKEMLKSKYRVHSIDTFVNEYKKKNPNEKVPCTKTVYNWIDKCYLKIRNIDLPVKTRRKATNEVSKPKGRNKKTLGTSR